MDEVRLCFQVFLREKLANGDYKNVPLPPVVSNPIYHKKSNNVSNPDNQLVIKDISEAVGSTTGGAKMIILCDRVSKDDIAVRFFQKKNDEIVWSALADLKPQNVHHQTGLSFRTPPYSGADILTESLEVFIELYRPSDGKTSLPTPFTYLSSKY